MCLGLLVYGFGCAGSGSVSSDELADATTRPVGYPEDEVNERELAAHLRFLASDELMGRETGTAGNDVAARYIAEQFRAAGLKPVPGMDEYFQRIPFVRTAPPSVSRLVLFGDTLRQGDEILVLNGEERVDLTTGVVFAGFGRAEDYEGLDVRGKIVVTQAGWPGERGVQAAYGAITAKRRLAAEHGAQVLVELYNESFPWQNLVRYLGTSRFDLDDKGSDESDLPVVWVHDAEDRYRQAIQQASDVVASFYSAGKSRQQTTSSNVLGIVEGSDPELRDEFVVLTAHFDHVGAGISNGRGATPADSIFNGARDNGMGTVALITAARTLSAQPPRRSVLLIALTAEEMGMLGSRYFVEHPPIPLKQMVFNLNIDGGGYSDTTIVTVIGLERTSAEPLIRKGASRYGLEAIADPAPEQNLFDRSDNVSFARRGIPAPTFSPGFRAFTDPGVANYYHRPEDEAGDDFDYAYLKRFAQAYAHTARLIADAPDRPAWRAGDKYEEAARMLYEGTE